MIDAVTLDDHETTTPNAREAIDHDPNVRMVTIREAARLCGTTPGAIRGRVERGSLRHVMRDGKRHIPIAELRRVGMLTASANAPMVPDAVSTTQLLDRLVEAERRATAAETRLQLTERAESSLTEALHRAHAEREAAREQADAVRLELEAERERADRLAADLEAAQIHRRRWFTRRNR